MYSRRSFLGGIAAALVGLALPERAEAAPIINIQRQLSLQMARAYALNGDKKDFRRLFDEQSAFLGLGWPQTELVVTSAMSALRRILDGGIETRMGLRKVRRLALPGHRYVVFSDHHAMPEGNRQWGVWRANRDAYASLLGHYGADGWIVVENGDVEDLVVVEPEITVAMYEKLTKSHARTAAPRHLVQWYRDDPDDLMQSIRHARSGNRQIQLEQLLSEPGNKPYYDQLRQLAKTGQLVRLAGNHDYNLQDLKVGSDWLVPDDVLVLEGDHPEFVVMHGHQFDAATHPGVAPLYGEVVSECLGIWYQGPDRSWSVADCKKILSGGFPNRLATHHGGQLRGDLTGRFFRALMSSPATDDEEWEAAWEGLFGHPIAWEYGARNWVSAVHGHVAHPGDLVDDAMTGRQFFKFRHLDEWEILRSLNSWDLQVGLVLGHSHEARYNVAGFDRARYYNSGAVGRYTHLLWAVEIVDERTVNIVGWFVEDDGTCRRFEFVPREDDLTSYFEPRRTDVVVPVRKGGAA